MVGRNLRPAGHQPGISGSRRRVMLSCIETITAKYIRIQDDPIWERIDSYIDGHIHDKITVEDISATIFISPSTIYHRTKQNTGMSLSNYVARRKMIKASEYLYLTDYKINYISTLLGIDDYNYFSRLFRRIFGMSPTSTAAPTFTGWAWIQPVPAQPVYFGFRAYQQIVTGGI